MKLLIVTILFVLFGLYGLGQEIKLIPKKLPEKYQFIPTAIWKLNHDLNYPKAKLFGENTFGKIFILPKDNMPCLVPDFNKIKKIPNASPFEIGNMYIPNPYQRNQIISTNTTFNETQLRKSIALHSTLLDN